MTLHDNSNIKIPKYVSVCAASIAGSVEAIIFQPFDVTKTRLQTDNYNKYKGVIDCFKTIYKNEGIKALYKGLTPFITNLSLKYALRLYTYELFIDILTQNNKTPLTFEKDLLAGLSSGVIEAVIIVTPLEVIKTRLQKQIGINKKFLKYKNPLHCAITLCKEEGFHSLMKGVVPTTIRQGTNQMFNFYTVNYINENMWNKKRNENKKLSLYQTMITGSLGGAIGPMFNAPFDVIKTRLQSQVTVANKPLKYTGVFDCFYKILREEGILSLYKGLNIRLARSIPGQAIMWSIIEYIKYIYINL
jgi:solute carrier family 25 citrate transporter 1